ncbi:MAG: hypothetical protein ACLVJ6_02950 [Merdibacter sp.]
MLGRIPGVDEACNTSQSMVVRRRTSPCPRCRMLISTVESVIFKGVSEMMIDTGDMRWKVHSTAMQPAGSRVGLHIVPFNIHIMHKEA